MKKIFKFTTIFCILMLVFSVQVFAKYSIYEDFENTTIPGIYGSGTLFNANTTITNDELSIDAEDNGVFINHYLKVKKSTDQNILVTNSGVLSDEITTISAKVKFDGGNTTGFIIRTGSSYVYLAVNNEGGTQLRLFNKYENRLDIDHSKWYHLYYVIDRTKNEIYGSITQADNPGKRVERTIQIDTDANMTASITADSHFSFVSSGTVSSPSNGMCIDEFIVRDKYEPDYLVNENFDRHKEGVVSSIAFSPLTGLKVT